MNGDAPVVSIVMPVYNCGPFLAPAIRSMLGQSFSDFELLLLNDGSTDGSLDVLRRFAADDARCTLVSRENRGLIPTLNQGLGLARGRYVARMDGDDLSRPNRLALQVDYLDGHADCVAVGSEVMLVDPEGWALRPFGLPMTHDAIDAQHLRGLGGALVHPATMLRASAARQVGGYREAFTHAEDYDLFLRLAEIGRLANLPDVLLDYRMHLGSIGHQHTSVQKDATDRALSEAQQRRGLSVCVPERGHAGPTRLADLHRKWAWWALQGGNLRSARKHALKTLRLAPLAASNLRLFACVLRGH